MYAKNTSKNKNCVLLKYGPELRDATLERLLAYDRDQLEHARVGVHADDAVTWFDKAMYELRLLLIPVLIYSTREHGVDSARSM